MEKTSIINLDALRSMHRFGDILTQAVQSINSPLVELEVLRDPADCIGRHWYGVRCWLTCKQTAQRFYLHIGFVFLPKTRRGVMVEVEQKNNRVTYPAIWGNIAPDGDAFEINKDEPDYLKLFLPEDRFAALVTMGRAQQVQLLAGYIQSCAQAIADAAATEGFRLNLDNLDEVYRLALQFEEVLNRTKSSEYMAVINLADPDNFGQYASGYRYYLVSPQGKTRLYAYFGVIYSYKKSPAGVFAEVDRHSNPELYNRVLGHVGPSDKYELNTAEEGFIKLFLPRDKAEAFNRADNEGQMAILAEFLDACNTCFIKAAQ